MTGVIQQTRQLAELVAAELNGILYSSPLDLPAAVLTTGKCNILIEGDTGIRGGAELQKIDTAKFQITLYGYDSQGRSILDWDSVIAELHTLLYGTIMDTEVTNDRLVLDYDCTPHAMFMEWANEIVEMLQKLPKKPYVTDAPYRQDTRTVKAVYNGRLHSTTLQVTQVRGEVGCGVKITLDTRPVPQPGATATDTRPVPQHKVIAALKFRLRGHRVITLPDITNQLVTAAILP